MKGLILSVAVAMSAALFPTVALACGGSGFGYIHERVPTPMPDGTVIAEVAFDGSGWIRISSPGTPVRVLRMIQGPSASTLILRLRTITSCDRPVAGGITGLIIGGLIGTENGVPVIQPYANFGDGRIGISSSLRPEPEETSRPRP